MRSFVWLIVSKDYEKSMVIMTVREEAFSWLSPSTTFWVRGRRADVVNLFFRKPCWVSANGRSATSSGRIRRSRILIAGLRSEMGLYDIPR